MTGKGGKKTDGEKELEMRQGMGKGGMLRGKWDGKGKNGECF